MIFDSSRSVQEWTRLQAETVENPRDGGSENKALTRLFILVH
uniref:Uncharacterized protein n=1 Tax=Arundo donax TaxID=35708 RepID=A0A0A8ZMJ4_ARUDO